MALAEGPPADRIGRPHGGDGRQAERRRQMQRPRIVADDQAAPAHERDKFPKLQAEEDADAFAGLRADLRNEPFLRARAEKGDLPVRLLQLPGQLQEAAQRPALGRIEAAGMDADDRPGRIEAALAKPLRRRLPLGLGQNQPGLLHRHLDVDGRQQALLLLEHAVAPIGRDAVGEEEAAAGRRETEPHARAALPGEPRGLQLLAAEGIDDHVVALLLQPPHQRIGQRPAEQPPAHMGGAVGQRDHAIDLRLRLRQRRGRLAAEQRQFRRRPLPFDRRDQRQGQDQIAEAIEPDHQNFPDGLQPRPPPGQQRDDREEGDRPEQIVEGLHAIFDPLSKHGASPPRRRTMWSLCHASWPSCVTSLQTGSGRR